MTILQRETSWGDPVQPSLRHWVRLEATPEEIARVAARLAFGSIEFTLDPYPENEYEISVKADQALVADRIIGAAA